MRIARAKIHSDEARSSLSDILASEVTWAVNPPKKVRVERKNERGQLSFGPSESQFEEDFAVRRRMILVMAFALSAGGSFPVLQQRVAAQNPPSQNPPPPPPSPGESSSKPEPNTDSAVESAPDQPKWDPLRADRDVDVGKYYMKKGDYDAAIDRFLDATEAKPGYAIPFRFLGECYEKQGKKKPAVKAYQRYLDLFPHADDGDKIRKKVEKLHQEIDKEKNG
jgi:tetratricopeptide (TPR) repeat protein